MPNQAKNEHGPPVGEPYCEACEEPTTGEYQDYGIGPYEFQGQRGNDVDVVYVSKCCGARVMIDGLEYEPTNY